LILNEKSSVIKGLGLLQMQIAPCGSGQAALHPALVISGADARFQKRHDGCRRNQTFNLAHKNDQLWSPAAPAIAANKVAIAALYSVIPRSFQSHQNPLVSGLPSKNLMAGTDQIVA